MQRCLRVETHKSIPGQGGWKLAHTAAQWSSLKMSVWWHDALIPGFKVWQRERGRGHDLCCRSPPPLLILLALQCTRRLSSDGEDEQELSCVWLWIWAFPPPALTFRCLSSSLFVRRASFLYLRAGFCWLWSARLILSMLILQLLSLWKHRHLHLGLFLNELLSQLVGVSVLPPPGSDLGELLERNCNKLYRLIIWWGLFMWGQPIALFSHLSYYWHVW